MLKPSKQCFNKLKLHSSKTKKESKYYTHKVMYTSVLFKCATENYKSYNIGHFLKQLQCTIFVFNLTGDENL